MAENKQVSEFADKWYKVFKSPNTSERDVDEAFGKDCAELGVSMDCGKAFQRQYGEQAFYDPAALDTIPDEVRDEVLLASAVYSKWRYITHWTQQSLLDSENRKWFALALDRLCIIFGESWAVSWSRDAQKEPPALQAMMMKTLEQYLQMHPEDEPDNK